MTPVASPVGETLKSCPFCSDPMQIKHGTLKHVDQGQCVIGAYAWDGSFVAAWNRRSLGEAESGLNGARDIVDAWCVRYVDGMPPATARDKLVTDILALRSADEDETYEIGKRDGYEQAVQDIDCLTGGDGEYRYCTDGDPERHTPDAATMKQRIADRFSEALVSPARSAEAGVKVKPLEWTDTLYDHGDGRTERYFEAITPFGTVKASSPEAGQSDYEQRIRSALVPAEPLQEIGVTDAAQIERVAKAIATVNGHYPDGIHNGEPLWLLYAIDASAALQALQSKGE